MVWVVVLKFTMRIKGRLVIRWVTYMYGGTLLELVGGSVKKSFDGLRMLHHQPCTQRKFIEAGSDNIQ